MSLANILVFALIGVVGLVGGCQSSSAPGAHGHETVEEHPIDGLSRDISDNQTGAVRNNNTLSPPPIRRDFDR